MSTSDSIKAEGAKARSGPDRQSNGAERVRPVSAAEVKSQSLARLSELQDLPPGWDGYGAPKLDPAITEAVRSFISSWPESITARPMVVPLSSGNIQLEWHRGPKVLELEFETPETVHYLKWHPEARIEEEHVVAASDREFLLDLIRWFAEEGEDG